MRIYVRSLCVLSVLAFSVAFAGCDRATELTAPDSLAPQFGPGNGNDKGKARGKPRGQVTQVAWGDFQAADAAATFVPGGGRLEITDGAGGPTIVGIIVRGGAVPGGPTEFSIDLDCDGDLCSIDLKATRGGREITSFRKPVEVYVNTRYLELEQGVDLSSIRLVQLLDGELEPVMNSRVTKDGFLRASLQHFSLYAPFSGYLPISD